MARASRPCASSTTWSRARPAVRCSGSIACSASKKPPGCLLRRRAGPESGRGTCMTTDNVTSIDTARPDHLAPVFAQFPLEVRDARGVYLHTPGGRRVLDLYGGHAVAALGYDHPRWVEALTKQAHMLCFQSNAVPLDVRRRAATKLANFCGLGLDTIFFVNSGAEANENALKLACKMTGGTHIVAVEGSFHGRTAAAGAVTWGADKKWFGFPRAPFDVTFIKPAEIDRLGTVVNDQTAAVIVEPVQGVA